MTTRASALRAHDVEHRTECLRCRRPTTHCFCALVPSLDAKTRVLFVQHPRERHVAIGTARMAHLALPSSILIEGTRVDDDPRVTPLFDAPNVAVLFPGTGARPLADWNPHPSTLVVLDGTWWQAKKLLTLNPRLAALPRLAYAPTSPGNYRIRTEPSDQHLATIEAVSAVLGELEGDPARFSTMLRPFTWMVDRQIDAARVERRPRHRKESAPRTPRVSSRIAQLERHFDRAVLVYAEANCHPRDARSSGVPEVLHVVMSRPSTHARASIVLRPRRPLVASVPHHLELDVRTIENGLPRDEGLARVRAFLDDDALFVLWGPYARDLLAREGIAHRGFVDVRAATKETLGRATGGVTGAAHTLGVTREPALEGRAGRVIALLEGITDALLRRARDEQNVTATRVL